VNTRKEEEFALFDVDTLSGDFVGKATGRNLDTELEGYRIERRLSERDYNLRLDSLKRAKRPWPTRLCFIWVRVTVVRRPAPNGVRDVDPEPFDFADLSAKELSGPSDEWPPLFVFRLSGTFTEDYYLRFCGAFTRYHLGARLPQMALLALHHLLMQLLQGLLLRVRFVA